MTTSTIPDAPAAPRSDVRTRVGRAAVATGGGLLLGVLTNLAQGWLPDAWQQLPNSGAVWSTVAFAVGVLLYRNERLVQAALGGAGAEVGLVLGYYGYAEFGRDGAGSLFFPLVWLGLALVAGPLFGVAGWWWRRGRDARRRVAGLGAFAGLWGMEGLLYAVDLHHIPEAYTCLALFVLIPLLMARDHKERALTMGAAAAFALIAYAAVVVPLHMVSA
ncbi:DUF6518 family protein [Streptomyces sp. ME02-6991-2A]|uniref:DUF6518 family protein n=1 Tax=Streptomyces sp. ME02-6991-2A TaxID=3028677 RepID=UPI00211B4300|nr:DUF6518 family protein [Streptomyces sp. ME02-6991-2A]MDX3374641.1 DUF6518 family protein [Streptomyces sp. ME02-6991-2A]